MTSLVVMNESLVTRMVNDVVTQRRIPSFCPCLGAPIRLSEPQEARKTKAEPRQHPNRKEAGDRGIAFAVQQKPNP